MNFSVTLSGCDRVFKLTEDIVANHMGSTVITHACVHKFVCDYAGEGWCITESAGGLGLGFTSAFLGGLEGIKRCPNVILTYRPGQTNRHTPDQAVGQ